MPEVQGILLTWRSRSAQAQTIKEGIMLRCWLSTRLQRTRFGCQLGAYVINVSPTQGTHVRLAPCFREWWLAKLDEEKALKEAENVQTNRDTLIDALLIDAQKLTKAKEVKCTADLRKQTSTSKYTDDTALAKTLQERFIARIASPRYQAMKAKRQELPVAAYRTEILQIINSNPVTIICGATGCGKTTQVPQFVLENLLESGECGAKRVVCTEPRRISAIRCVTRLYLPSSHD